MISPKELRIGNWISVCDEEHQITGVSLTKIEIEKDGPDRVILGIAGIPLTAEWLDRFVFVDGIFGLEIKIKDKYGNINTLYFENGHVTIDGFATPVESVHQLQNLYFALTGQELELKK